MKRSLAVYAAVLGVALVGAYLSWSGALSDEEVEGIVVAEYGRDDIRTIRWRDDEWEFTVQPRSDERGPYAWVEQRRLKGKESGSQDQYKASDAADHLFEALDPLEATRTVAPDSSAGPAKFGLDDPTATLTLETADGDHRFEVGDHTYGRRHLYLRDTRDGTVYVVDSESIGVLKYGDARLPETGLTGHRARAVKRVALEVDEREAELVHHNLDRPTASYWTVGETPQKSRPAGSWVKAFLRLEIEGYHPDRSPEEFDSVLHVTVEPTDGEPTRIRLMRETNPDGPDTWFAHSQFNRSVVELKSNRAARVLQDARRLASSDQSE